MDYDGEITCLECGESFDASKIDLHIAQEHRGGKTREESRAERRLIEKQARKKSSAKLVVGAVIVVIILLVASFVFLQNNNNTGDDGPGFQDTIDEPDVIDVPDDGNGDGNGNGNGNGNGDNGTDPEPEPTKPAVKIPVDDITEDVTWYPYDSDGVEIRFFCGLGTDNEFHVAFDACDECYIFKQGYRQDGEDMVCNACRKRFPLDDCGTENQDGGCWPSYLPMEIDGDDVIILIEDLEDNRYMFE